MAIRETTVFIFLPGETIAVPAGIFSHDSELDAGIFAYGRRYVQRAQALAADPIALPLGVTPAAVTTNGGLYGAFRDAAPDSWGRMVIATTLRTVPEALSELDFLLAPQATRVGNLDFRTSPREPEPDLAPPQFNQLQDIMIAARDVEQGRPTPQHMLQLLRQGSSMGGARPKCTVQLDDALWIAKFPSRSDSINMPRAEFATMKLGARCAIRIPELRVVDICGKDVLLVKRFDRTSAAQGWVRNGYLSSLSLMQLDEYDRLHWSYLTLASLMRRHCDIEDIHELFRRMVFNILVRNTDDHPRNHGFLTMGTGLALSPAFDIVPSLAQEGVGADFSLAMTLGAKGREASVENALSECSSFGLTREAAQSIIDEMMEITAQWRMHYEECGVSTRDIGLLAPSFAVR